MLVGGAMRALSRISGVAMGPAPMSGVARGLGVDTACGVAVWLVSGMGDTVLPGTGVGWAMTCMVGVGFGRAGSEGFGSQAVRRAAAPQRGRR